MQSEIDGVVGNGRLPTLDDRIKYVLDGDYASINEITITLSEHIMKYH